VFAASRSQRGDKGRNDRKFLEALHYFVVHNITWRALPEKFGHWNSVWKRFWRLSRSGTFEAFFDALAAMSETAHLVQMFDSTVVRAHVSAAGADCVAGGGRRGIWIHSLRLRVPIPLTKRIRFSEFLVCLPTAHGTLCFFQKQVPLMAAVHSILPACYLQLNVRRRADKNRLLRPAGKSDTLTGVPIQPTIIGTS
jgi:transposase